MSSDSEYTLYYWPTTIVGPGRGGFIRLIFEEAGVKFNEVSDKTTLAEWFKQEKLEGYPGFAPPMLRHGTLQLTQTPVICKYLGKKLDMYPETEEDELHADQLNITIHDFIADGRLAFHGKDFNASYFDQQEETKPYIERFIKTRLPKWLGHLQKALKYNNEGHGFLVGNKLTYVDLALLHVLRATEAQFPDAWRDTDAPLLKAFKTRIESRPMMAAYLKSDRVIPFSGNSMM